MTQLWRRYESADRTYSLPLRALIHEGPPRTPWALSVHGVPQRLSVRCFAFGGEEKMNRSSQGERPDQFSRSGRSIEELGKKQESYTEGHKEHSAAKPQPKLEEHRGLRLKGICENTFN